MASLIDMSYPVFPAETEQDIDFQIISNNSSQRLLQAYLDQRVPLWKDDGAILQYHEQPSDLTIKSHRKVWKVHRVVFQSVLPVFLEEHRKIYTKNGPTGKQTVMVNYDKPLAIESLLIWMYSGEPPSVSPLKSYDDWDEMMDLWVVAEKYQAWTLMDDISALVLCSKPPSWGGEEMLVHLVKTIRQFPERFMLQANEFLRRLMHGCRKRISRGEVDGLVAAMPCFLGQRKRNT